MELNTKYLVTSELVKSDGNIQFRDYRGQNLVSLTNRAPINGDLVVVLTVDGETVHRTLESTYEIDTIVKRRLITELNQVFARQGDRTRIRDYDLWYRDSKGHECLGSKRVH